MGRCRQRLEGVLARDVVEDLLLLDTESGQIHQLNRAAGLIWRSCDGRRSAEEIAKLLEREFEVEHHVALKDVVDTLLRLQALNLLVDTEHGPPAANA